MRTLKTLAAVLVLAVTAVSAVAAPKLADLAPANAGALVETVDAAGLRQMLLDSRFWDALGQTEAVRQWRASPRYAEAQQRIDQFLANLEMTRDEAIQTYLGQRSAVVLLPSGDIKKPYGVILVETDAALAERLIKAAGGERVGERHGVAVWEVRKDNRVDRMAYAGGMLMICGAKANELEQVIDVAAGGAPSLTSRSAFSDVAESLPEGWRTRAFAAEAGPHKIPGAVAMYPKDHGRVHFEWCMAESEDLDINAPVLLTGPKALPASAVAAGATSLHLQAVWAKVQEKVSAMPDGAEKIRKADMFIRGWFPGYSMDAIAAAFGPEAAGALVKGNDGSAPGLVGIARLTASGQPVAQAFKNGLAAKAMILGALGQNNENAPKIGVREETYANASLVIIEAPAMLEKALGPWAKDIGLTVAVTNEWLVVGTTPAGVKETLDAAAGTGASLAAALEKDGDAVPAKPVTRWGVLQPASGADIVLAWAERVAGKERVDQIKKVTNLAELMKLVKRIVWQRTDEANMVRGTADIQAID